MADLVDRIIKYMLALNYKVFTGQRQYNIVYVEGMNIDGSLNADPPNCFNDRRLIIQVLDGKPKVIGNWEATTEPGSYYTDRPMSPRTKLLGLLLGNTQLGAWECTARAIAMKPSSRSPRLKYIGTLIKMDCEIAIAFIADYSA